METVYEALIKLPKQYTVYNGISTIKVIYNVEPHVRYDINNMMNDIDDCLKQKGIKYERKIIRFFSEYPSFLIYEDEQNIGIVTFNFGMSL